MFSNTSSSYSLKYRKKTETTNFLMKSQSQGVHFHQLNTLNTPTYNISRDKEVNGFDYFGSVTPRPMSKSYKTISDSMQDFSIFHSPYAYETAQSMGRKDEYKYENTENFQKVQAIRGKQKMLAVRPFLYL